MALMATLVALGSETVTIIVKQKECISFFSGTGSDFNSDGSHIFREMSRLTRIVQFCCA